MILAIDMGNSNIKIGVVDSDGKVIEERVTTAADKTSMEYAMDIISILAFHGINKSSIEGAVLSSVVPPLTGVISTAIRKVTGKSPLLVSNKIKMSIKLNRMKYPEKVGADLLAGAEIAYNSYKSPVIIVNMGTATTITIVNEQAEYLGGVILPGLKVSLNSLSNSAAQLPYISLETPGSVIGNNTIDCMRSGILYGNAAQIDGIIERMEKELSCKATVVATGGLAKFVVPLCSHSIILDETLLMKGLLALYNKNKEV
ncbi:MAG: type III pantothenate kinase [Eubacteriales bacterium]|nr:type III pantothenate kinase [Eubacteriales bacterium]